MAFLAIIPALIAAAAATGTSIASSVQQDNANQAAAEEALKQRQFQQQENQKNMDAQALSTDEANQNSAGQMQQGQYAKAVNAIQGAAGQRQKELGGVADTIARSLIGGKAQY